MQLPSKQKKRFSYKRVVLSCVVLSHFCLVVNLLRIPHNLNFLFLYLWLTYRWDETHQECVYRKCAEQCPNGDINPGGEVNGVTMFEYQAKLYERRWYCCNDRPLCNSKSRTAMCTPQLKFISWVLSYQAFLLVMYLKQVLDRRLDSTEAQSCS